MRVLFIKLTSMGDLIHALPALTDAQRAHPSMSFDWVIEKSFSEVALWHPAVNRIIPTSHRHWRKNFRASLKNGEIKDFIRAIRAEKYDLVIDGQTSIKSAVTSLLSKGLRCGLDRHSARESLASFAYQKKISVPKEMHAIERLRLLFSQVLNYPYEQTAPDYHIDQYDFPALTFALPKPYIVLVHNASWSSKLWPEAYWRKLTILAAESGVHVVLPWGNSEEKLRALRIAHNQSNATVLPFCRLSEHATILKNALGAICSDTGLSHLAAALNVPSVTLYGSTSTKLIGTQGLYQNHLRSNFACKECYKTLCRYNDTRHQEPLCLTALKPETVWEGFRHMVRSARS